MQEKFRLILATPPTDLAKARSYHFPIAHMAYRIGSGPHLLRSQLPASLRGGYMVLDDQGFDGRGEPGLLCQEIMRECNNRGYTGLICNFGDHMPLLGRVITALSPGFRKRNWRLYVTEDYARDSETSRVLIPTALSGGSLQYRLEEVVELYGAQRITLDVNRSIMDFQLPSTSGQGQSMGLAELQEKITQRSPTVFFSNDLCAHYFTYMTHQSGAHFILFDDADSIKSKMRIAHQVGIAEGILAYPEVADLLVEMP